MKKTITMLLLTALCVTAFASCDLGNGLVAELFGNIGGEYEYELIEPSEDIIVNYPDAYWGTVEVETQTTPSYEIDTEYDTIEEYWSEDITWDVAIEIEPVESPVQVMYCVTQRIECQYVSGDEVFREIYLENEQPWVDPHDITVEAGPDSLIVSGYVALTGTNYAIFGYSINEEGPYYAADYQRDPDPVVKEIYFEQGADYVNGYSVKIPLAALPAGRYEIMIWYANYNNEAELATNVEDSIAVFTLEIAQPLED